MERLIIKKFVLGIMSTNCYLIENNNHSILIDPGDKAELLINYLTQNNLLLLLHNINSLYLSLLLLRILSIIP